MSFNSKYLAAALINGVLCAACISDGATGKGEDPSHADFVGTFPADAYIAAVSPFWDGDTFAADRFQTCPCLRTPEQVGPLGDTDLVRSGPSDLCQEGELSGTLLDEQGFPTSDSHLSLDFYLPKDSWRDYLCLPYLRCLQQAEQGQLAGEALQTCRDAALFHCEEQGVYHYCQSETPVAADGSFTLATLRLGKARLMAQVPELGDNAEPHIDVSIAKDNAVQQLSLIERAWGWELTTGP